MIALDWPLLLIIALAAYLIGSLSTAVITARLLGLPDPRSAGSGNPGATNIMRLGGKKAAIVTLAGDLLKGWIPVALTAVAITAADRSAAMAAAGLFAFLGHLYPAFFGFKGGKGVATASGVILGLAPMIGLIAIISWLATAWLTRYSSLSALLAAAVAAILAILFAPPVIAATILLMALFLTWRHRDNIQRLIRGKESRIGEKTAPLEPGE